MTDPEITTLAELCDVAEADYADDWNAAIEADERPDLWEPPVVEVQVRALRALLAEREGMRERFKALADELDRAAMDRQSWADHPDIGGMKPKLESHLRGKRYGYSHAAQLIRAALTTEGR